MMKIILIRHGSREDDGTPEGKDTPLSNGGRNEACQLGDMLARLGLKPEVYLTSHYKHAREMGDILAAQLSDPPPARVLSLCALTPKSPIETFEDIVDEARNAGIDLSALKVVAVVGHEARLSQLLTRLTSARARPFGRAEVVCLKADLFRDFLKGKGTVEFRIPVVDYQEEKLRPKIQSKMTVSTFLAGFTFAALIELLLKEGAGNLSLLQAILQRAAAIFLTAALALFIAAVYIYDQLTMPEGFWAFDDRPKWRKVWIKEVTRQFEEDRRRHGILYASMVWTWGWVFSPAVALGLVGFIAILFNTEDGWVMGGGLVAIVAVLLYYRRARPQLGID